MSLRDLVVRASQQLVEPFIAPIPEVGRGVTVFTRQAGIPHTFNLYGNRRPGWWLMQLGDTVGSIEQFRPALPWEIHTYLEDLPRFYVIALFPLADQTWSCMPYNASDAEQRGWPNGHPRTLHLTMNHNILPYDILIARDLAGTLLYNAPGGHVDDFGWPYRLRTCLDEGSSQFTSPPAFKNAHNIIQEYVYRQRRLATARRMEQRLERKIDDFAYALEFMGAELLAVTPVREGYTVQWEHNGAEFTMPVGEDGMVMSAGICLDGTDNQHNLSSIVSVMQRARELGRYDLPERLRL